MSLRDYLMGLDFTRGDNLIGAKVKVQKQIDNLITYYEQKPVRDEKQQEEEEPAQGEYPPFLANVGVFLLECTKSDSNQIKYIQMRSTEILLAVRDTIVHNDPMVSYAGVYLIWLNTIHYHLEKCKDLVVKDRADSDSEDL